MRKLITDEVREFASRLTAWGFVVYLAESNEYGFISDASGKRVLAFSFNDCGSLSGHYGPPSRAAGTGWRMDLRPHELTDADKVRTALYAEPPKWTPRQGHTTDGWRYLTTVEQELAAYGPSSRFTLFVEGQL